ncbi:hypothetical protein DUNSADRAFT_2113, partial [Dunaliella salina]
LPPLPSPQPPALLPPPPFSVPPPQPPSTSPLSPSPPPPLSLFPPSTPHQSPLPPQPEVLQSPPPPAPLPTPPHPAPPLPPPATVPPDDLEYDGSTYFFIGLGAGQELSFLEADSVCRESRGNLVTIQSRAEHVQAVQALIQRFFQENPFYTALQFWAGYQSFGNATLLATDGSSTAYVEVDRKAPELVDNWQCVYAQGAAQGKQLSDFATANCTQLRPAMCEVSSCSTCDTCVETWYTSYTSLDTSRVNFEARCNELGYPPSACGDAAFTIASSLTENGTSLLENRPAAICNLLNECDSVEGCKIRGANDDGALPVVVEGMDFCTADGTISGEFLGDKEFPTLGDGCLNADDCSSGQFCDETNSTRTVYRCDPATGQEESATRGTCSSLCNLPIIRNRLDRLSQVFTEDAICDPENGTSTSECPPGYLCGEPSDSCALPGTYSCSVDENGDIQITEGESCPGQCYPGKRNMTSAAFTNSGRSVLVGLSAQADNFAKPCSEIFDTDTMSRLASSGCSVSESSRSTLRIELSSDATIMPGNFLRLKNDNILRAFLVENGQVDATFDSSGSVNVTSCSDCEAPSAQITGTLPQVSELCPSQRGDDGEGFQPIVINGQKSNDPSGRPFKNVIWRALNDSLDENCVISNELTADIGQSNRDQSLSLTLRNSSLTALQVSKKYCISLTVTSFLGQDSVAATHQLAKE